MGNIGVHFSSCLGPYLVFSFLTEKKNIFLIRNPLNSNVIEWSFLYEHKNHYHIFKLLTTQKTQIFNSIAYFSQFLSLHIRKFYSVLIFLSSDIALIKLAGEQLECATILAKRIFTLNQYCTVMYIVLTEVIYGVILVNLA